MQALVVYSGGMDSTVALYDAVDVYGAENIAAVSFNYNSKHNEQEYIRALNTTKKLGVKHKRLDIKEISAHLVSHLLIDGGSIPEGHYEHSTMKKTVVPFRNGIMLAIAAGIAESNDCNIVLLGNHAGDHAVYPDCRPEFIEAFSQAMSHGTYNNVYIKSPFCNLKKTDIVKLGESLKVDWLNTYSCYKGGEQHCGLCSTCYERREAFYLAGVKDPTFYYDKTEFTMLREKYESNKTN